MRLPRARLFGLCGVLGIAAFGLASVAGPPRLPDTLPSPEFVVQLLGGSSLPLDGVLLLLLDLAWLLWAWITLSLLLEVLLVGAELVAFGNARLRMLRKVVDRLSPPLVRRGVAAAFAVQLISRGVPIAAAQTITAPTETVQAETPTGSNSSRDGIDGQWAGEPTYLVRPGDTLWSIAEQAYGSGSDYRRLLQANLGRSMPDGQVFSARGVIRPGWRLIAPGATWSAPINETEPWYTVSEGDTLSSIADSMLGDEGRWSDLFALNYGATSPDGHHALVDPNTIWPGLRLRLVDMAVDSQDDTAVESPPEVSEPVELQAASAPPPVADPAPPSESAQLAAFVHPGLTPPVAQPTPPPLVRTQHAVQPVVLDRVDRASQMPDEPGAGVPAAAPPTASDLADVDSATPLGPGPLGLPTAPLALGGLGLAGLAGLAVGARRLRRLRPMPKHPESEVAVHGGFAESQLTHEFTRGLHGIGADSVATLVMRLQRFLAEYHLTGADVVSVRDGRSSTTIAVRCGLAEQAVLLDVAQVFAERLDSEVEACVSGDQDVLLRLTRLRRTRLLPTADAADSASSLLSLGVLYDRQVFSVSWNALGHVLIASLPGHGSNTILTSLVATATARHSPELLRVWCIASSRALPAPLFDLPHMDRIIDPGNQDLLAGAIDELRAEVDRRGAHRPSSDLMVAVAELSTLQKHAAGLALLAGRAAEVGVRLVVGCSNPEEALSDPLTPWFPTRLVLRMQTEEASVGLLGVADAAFLAGGGRLLLRLDGRDPVELYGYQISPESLERLVKMMHAAYPIQPRSDSAPPSQPAASPPAQTGESEAASGPSGTVKPAPGEGEAEASESACVETPTSPPALPTNSVPTAPIQIFCLGSPRVACAGRTVWPRTGGDAKPWELILFLACQPAEGVSREAAVQAMWPEDEIMEDAGHRFRQLRYRLRRQLQSVPGAPESDGVCFDRRELKFDPGIVYSDAQEFVEHIRAVRVNPGPDAIQRLERARSLYVGDLLEGPDTRRYAWVDERGDSGVTLREHFRKLFQNASIRLAELYTADGLLDQAIELYRELTDIDPADERLWLALFRVHAQRKDREALVEEELRLRQTLRDLAEEVDISDQPQADEPSRETREEFQRLLASIEEREPAAV